MTMIEARFPRFAKFLYRSISEKFRLANPNRLGRSGSTELAEVLALTPIFSASLRAGARAEPQTDCGAFIELSCH